MIQALNRLYGTTPHANHQRRRRRKIRIIIWKMVLVFFSSHVMIPLPMTSSGEVMWESEYVIFNPFWTPFFSPHDQGKGEKEGQGEGATAGWVDGNPLHKFSSSLSRSPRKRGWDYTWFCMDGNDRRQSGDLIRERGWLCDHPWCFQIKLWDFFDESLATRNERGYEAVANLEQLTRVGKD